MHTAEPRLTLPSHRPPLTSLCTTLLRCDCELCGPRCCVHTKIMSISPGHIASSSGSSASSLRWVVEKLALPEDGGSGLCCCHVLVSWSLPGFSPLPLYLYRIADKVQSKVLYLSLAKELDGVSGKHFSSSCVITLPPEAVRILTWPKASGIPQSD